MKTHYDYPEIIKWLEQKGKTDYGTQFHFCEADQNNLSKLIAYYLKDEVVATLFDLDLSKGILLTGPIGCGKTSLMSLMKYVTHRDNRFHLKTCRDISFEFIKDGYEVIHRYSRGNNQEGRNYCFDDLGVEKNLKYFGNECNVMAEIILSRYDLFVAKKVQTHITTNLSASEIENAYGNRVRSRMRAMLNLISFDKSTPDKR